MSGIAIIENYSQILIYENKNDEVVLKSRVYIEGRENDSILDACFDDEGKIYCRLEDDTLVSVDRKTGKILREYNWLPGLIIAGCDFDGVVAEEGVKEILKNHGAILINRIDDERTSYGY